MLTNPQRAGLLLLTGTFCLFCLIGCGTESGSGKKGYDVKNAETKNYQTEDIGDMIAEVETNALRAKEKYNGRNVKIVNGIVTIIQSDGSSLQLDTDEASESFVTVKVYSQNSSQTDQFKNLSNNQKVTVYGTVTDIDETTGYLVALDKVLSPDEDVKEKQAKFRPKQDKSSQKNANQTKNTNQSYDISTPDGTFRYYHAAITKHDLHAAYQCFSDEFQEQMEYGGWAAGYDTTLQSIPEKIEIMSNDGYHATLVFRLKAVDRVGNSTKTQYFIGECNLIKVNGAWRIDSISARYA